MKLLPAMLLPLLALLGVYLLTSRLRVYALARLVDVPNPRSSHVVPTPRGGGAAIVIVTLLALPILAVIGALSWRTACGWFGAGALVAAVGFSDDHAHIEAKWRLLAHFIAAVWLVGWIGGLPPLWVGGPAISLGWFGDLLAILYVMWLLNLSNFMDGIDGIAAVEVITVSLSGALLYLLAALGGTRWMTPLVVAGATVGFLLWNWPPAKIFMGDVGSGFLGLALAALSLDAAWVAPRLFWAWIILLGVFVVDATVTLVRRTARGDRFYEAHRTHAYQHAAARWGAHLPVTVATGLITLVWLLPLAILVTVGTFDGISGVLIAYAPLVIAALWLNAGKPTG
jgi:Fuc2NAc and GlcNAc transferase